MSALCSVMAACWSVCTVIIAESMVLIADRSEANWSVETVGATVGATAEAVRSCAEVVASGDFFFFFETKTVLTLVLTSIAGSVKGPTSARAYTRK